MRIITFLNHYDDSGMLRPAILNFPQGKAAYFTTQFYMEAIVDPLISNYVRKVLDNFWP